MPEETKASSAGAEGGRAEGLSQCPVALPWLAGAHPWGTEPGHPRGKWGLALEPLSGNSGCVRTGPLCRLVAAAEFFLPFGAVVNFPQVVAELRLPPWCACCSPGGWVAE